MRGSFKYGRREGEGRAVDEEAAMRHGVSAFFSAFCALLSDPRCSHGG